MELCRYHKKLLLAGGGVIAALVATPVFADMPPIGYVGPAPQTTTQIAPAQQAPLPIGYVGEVPSQNIHTAQPVATTPNFAITNPPPPVPVKPAPVKAVSVSSQQLQWPIGYVGEVQSQNIAPLPPTSRASPNDKITALALSTNVGAVSNDTMPAATAQPSKSLPIGYVGEVPRKPTNTKSSANTEAHVGETLITAQTMHSDDDTGIMTASGKVEIVRSNYEIHADKATYDQKNGVMTLDGHTALLAPTGEVEFAQHQEATGDMKQAYAENAGILFPDNSRMAAAVTQRYEGRYALSNQAVYTSCNVCRENPDNPPLWQMRAESITQDNDEHKIYYHDATLDMFGVPIAYTPYFSGPDPTVKRLQGFLTPTVGYSSYVGPYAKVPYYFDISPDKDLVLTPDISQTDKIQLAEEYRERFANGKLDINGSITQADLVDDTGVDKGQHIRGDLFGNFLYDFDSTWRAGSDVQYASDKSYLQRYQISSLSQTISHGYVEGLNGRDYASLDSYYFQDLRPGTDVSEPIVPPSATVSLKGDPNQTFGGRWSFDGNTLITVRDNANEQVVQQGPDTRRLSLNGGWERQLVSDTGLETTISGLVRTDSYWADNVLPQDSTSSVYNEAIFTRQFEQANAVMRYPMGRSGDGYQQLLEPIVGVTAAPDVRIISEQPNEESQDVEFDETNLFSPNRFTGSDLIEGGSRVTYGVRNAITTDKGARIDIFGGESHDFSSNNQFPTQSGLATRFSDYVGRIDFAPVDWFNANYGFRLSESNLSPQRQDAYLAVGEPIFQPFARYLQAYEDITTIEGETVTDGVTFIPANAITTDQIEQVRQVTVGFSSTFKKYWVLSANHVQSFDPSPGPRTDSLSLTYVDECLGFGVSASHDDTNRADLSSGTSVAFHLFLKNLGGIHTDSTSGIPFPSNFRQTDQ